MNIDKNLCMHVVTRVCLFPNYRFFQDTLYAPLCFYLELKIKLNRDGFVGCWVVGWFAGWLVQS